MATAHPVLWCGVGRADLKAQETWDGWSMTPRGLTTLHPAVATPAPCQLIPHWPSVLRPGLPAAVYGDSALGLSGGACLGPACFPGSISCSGWFFCLPEGTGAHGPSPSLERLSLRSGPRHSVTLCAFPPLLYFLILYGLFILVLNICPLPSIPMFTALIQIFINSTC